MRTLPALFQGSIRKLWRTPWAVESTGNNTSSEPAGTDDNTNDLTKQATKLSWKTLMTTLSSQTADRTLTPVSNTVAIMVIPGGHSWKYHDLETPSASLALCGGLTQRASNVVLWIFFTVSLNKLLNKWLSCHWFETTWSDVTAIHILFHRPIHWMVNWLFRRTVMKTLMFVLRASCR